MESSASRPDDVADRLIPKIRAFVETLDRDERAVLAALLAPGIVASFPVAAGSEEVQAFGYTEWDNDALRKAMRRSVERIPDDNGVTSR